MPIEWQSLITTPTNENTRYTENTWRWFLQVLGTDAVRDNIHENSWVNALFADYRSLSITLDNGRTYLTDRVVDAEKTSRGYRVPRRNDVPEEHWGKEISCSRFSWTEISTEPIFPKWIITDTRFKNEADAVKEHGGIMLRINRTGMNYMGKVVPIQDVPSSEKPAKYFATQYEHPSETSLDNYTFDHVIQNDGSVEELEQKVKEFLTQFKLI